MRLYLTIRWRDRWMTEKMMGSWLGGSAHYRMMLTGSSSDNPDERIADDIDNCTTTIFALGLGLLSKATSLPAFADSLGSYRPTSPSRARMSWCPAPGSRSFTRSSRPW